MSGDHYIIRGGVEGRDRLRMLAGVLRPSTNALLARVGVGPGLRCLDAGCGAGDITFGLARLVGPTGTVVGIDLDDTKLALDREEAAARGLTSVEFRHADVSDLAEDDPFDLVYARFLLSHLPDPAFAIDRFRDALRPGGWVALEDVDFSGHFSDPDSIPFERYIALYTATAERRGAHPTIGSRLPRLLRGAGFEQVELHVIQPAAFTGDIGLLSALTLENIAPAVLAAGLATEQELDRLTAELYAVARDPNVLLSLPRIVQTWGQRPTE